MFDFIDVPKFEDGIGTLNNAEKVRWCDGRGVEKSSERAWRREVLGECRHCRVG